ncbi:MAG: Asp23/Gls24 family envelope stress response protein [Coriobacteriales bacterium]|jgi:uncharacterized alkaline shock family protein YloU|nr:Asp23/Gls24 family envelope stress response protein [Coriobacteriales bacterium]
MDIDEKLMNEGLAIAPGVVETIVSLAVCQVDGVAQVGAPSLSNSFASAFRKWHPAQGILIMADDDEQITVAVHVQVFYGYRLQEVAEGVRGAVVDALYGQVGIEVASVDVFIDGIQFPE